MRKSIHELIGSGFQAHFAHPTVNIRTAICGCFLLLTTASCCWIDENVFQHRFRAYPLILDDAAAGRLDKVKEYIEANGDPNVTNKINKDGMTPLIYAAFFSDRDYIIEYLLRHGANPWLKDRTSMTALDWAKYDRDKALREHADINGPNRSVKILEDWMAKHPEAEYER